MGPDYKRSGWHLKMLGIASTYQRRGIGTALVKFVEDMVSFRMICCSDMTMTVSPSNAYLKLRFEKIRIVIPNHDI